MPGGARIGTGPKRGSKKAITKKSQELARKAAEASGMLPHEILLAIARGEKFTVKKLVIEKYKTGPRKGEEKSREWVDEEYWPSFNDQVDAAKAAAPYFTPRLATQTVKTDEKTREALSTVMGELSKVLPG